MERNYVVCCSDSVQNKRLLYCRLPKVLDIELLLSKYICIYISMYIHLHCLVTATVMRSLDAVKMSDRSVLNGKVRQTFNDSDS